MRRSTPDSLMRWALAVCSPLAFAAQSQAADVERHPLGGGSTFPIARAVTVPASHTLVFHSGTVPTPADPKAKPDTPAYWGNTRTQAASVFARLEESLAGLGLGLRDTVKMTVFLVGDPALGGRMDFDGFMDAYRQHFGTQAQPNLPARSTVQVAALGSAGMLVEIELVLARPAGPPSSSR